MNSLATRFSVKPKVTRKFLPMDVEQWGKLCCLKGGDIMHTYKIVSKHMDSRDTSFIHMRELLSNFFVKLIYLSLFPNSMSNLLTETSAIETFLKSSSFKHFSGNFCTSSSFSFPKAQNLEQRSIKMFVLRLFNKFMLTLKGCCQFHCIQQVVDWTSLTSNPSNALSAMLKTEENGDW